MPVRQQSSPGRPSPQLRHMGSNTGDKAGGGSKHRGQGKGVFSLSFAGCGLARYRKYYLYGSRDYIFGELVRSVIDCIVLYSILNYAPVYYRINWSYLVVCQGADPRSLQPVTKATSESGSEVKSLSHFYLF